VKKPLIKGYHGGSWSRRAIARWPWEEALALGWSLPAGVIGLDVDIKHGHRGDRDLALLEGGLGAFPDSARQDTPSGGFHLLAWAGSDQAAQVGSSIRIPDGSRASINIARRWSLFLRIYDPDFPFADIPQMPPEWLAALIAEGRRQERLDCESVWTGDSNSTVRAVREAREGTRNDTLYRAVGAVSSRGLWTPRVEDELSAAAEAAGLDVAETIGTIASARMRFEKREAFADEWLSAVREDEWVCRSGVRRTALRVAEALAQRHIRYGSRTGFSVRDASLEAGVSKSTAHARLAELCGASYAQQTGSAPGEAMKYTLRLPGRCSGSDSSTVVGGTQTEAVSPNTTAELSEYRRQHLQLARHDVFLRLGRESGLPPAGAEVLAAVITGAQTVAAITEMSGVSEAAVYKCLRIFDLDHLGLLDYRRRKVPVAVVIQPDVAQFLDGLAVHLGVQGSREARAAQYAEDRRRFAETRAPSVDEKIGLLLNQRTG
jgi:hypothetical protein